MSKSDHNRMLDMVLALDRALVEFSLRAYDVPRRQRSMMRKHSRRLHHAIRQLQPASSRQERALGKANDSQT